MDLDKVITELIRERNLIDEAIAHLERLSTGAQGISIPQRRTQSDKLRGQVRAAGAGFG
jgi:hypothetical protein